MLSLRRRHLLIGLLVLLTLATNAFVAYWNITRLVYNERLVARTFQTEAQIERVVSLVKDIETGQRGFILTGNEIYLEPYARAKNQLTAALDDLQQTTNDPQQKRSLPQLRAEVAARLQSAQFSIRVRRIQGGRAAIRFIRLGADKEQMDAIRDRADIMKEREDELLAIRTGELSDSAQDAFRTFWIATGANILFLSFISGLLIQAARQNRKLERSIRDLERAEGLRDSMSQMLVHDLRTPLTTLLTPLQMLQMETLGPLDETQKEVVTMSAQSGMRLLNMVNGLLDISKMEAGELKLKHTQWNVEKLLKSACQEAKGSTDTSTATVSFDVPADLQINADHDLIERVVINLLGNALKFTPADGLVTLRACSLENAMRVEVQDTGEGIPEAAQQRIFDKFGQVETRKNGHKASTGLGLTFCKLAIESHGGHIGVQSQLGQGSIFWFELPRR